MQSRSMCLGDMFRRWLTDEPLPTGSGKSLCYAALPFVSDILRARAGSVVVVVCPLQSIMESKYRARGLQSCPATCKPLVFELSHWKELQDAGYTSYQTEHHIYNFVREMPKYFYYNARSLLPKIEKLHAICEIKKS